MKMPAFRRLVFLLPICLLTACASIPRVDRSLSSPDQSSRVKYLVLHYTVTDTPRSIHIFTGHSQGQASIHYLLTDAEQPVIHGIVDESRAAYHAGSDSGWKNDRQLNLTSIGIEIVNAGWVDGPNGRTWAPFPEKQIDTLIPLVKDIMARHHIAPEHVLGHSDIAPQRKQDPGALFLEAPCGGRPGAVAGRSRRGKPTHSIRGRTARPCLVPAQIGAAWLRRPAGR
ncbi:N-acetylmuramoyl-L-alanine amidase [Massilia sp. MB5]|uniref:N-acetylmuramoyl-L-alanine amidase n=1 Tax=Massilia sp. MB5 TaxID=2919578 RepID=UPI001F1151EB|nr:N-acetylmuramoyl-L-alanine amidase [Massilia sp. MB5]UMR30085.1 N-acetylmuramoyl-L-alanine amidase [Massilia sp. MB5]